eukprot:TRINITY_DN32439_c0_g1_i2.p1 TRINITY_DN32439_c0_g1~~TRINITY_DN32439_c0_g1_i2.p1  ORF type:complete len:210 (+),score=38.20 TRINITY_DN32439_c0_g1_i2:77-706(+)
MAAAVASFISGGYNTTMSLPATHGASSASAMSSCRKKRQAEAAVPADTLSLNLKEGRLPASTMLFSWRLQPARPQQAADPVAAALRANEDDSDEGEQEEGVTPPETFYTSASSAQNAAMDDAARVVQWKVAGQMRILEASMSVWQPEAADKLRQEADSRGLDGVLLHIAGSELVSLLRPEMQVRLIDDDKVAGRTQQLLTDMLTRMSLR